MKTYLIPLFLLSTVASSSQNLFDYSRHVFTDKFDKDKIVESSADTFIRSSEIDWACGLKADYALRSKDFSLWDYLTTLLKEEKLKIFSVNTQGEYYPYVLGIDTAIDTNIESIKRIWLL